MVRRVITHRDESGHAVIASDGPIDEVPFDHTPGFKHSLVWRTAAPPVADGSSLPADPASFVPGPGESIALTVTFPPDSVFMSEDFDPAAAVGENLRRLPGLADLFEPDAPGMHTTPTVDYAVVIEGQVVLEVDGGATTTLDVGDIVVQNGTRHAWRVPSDSAATIFVVLIGHAG